MFHRSAHHLESRFAYVAAMFNVLLAWIVTFIQTINLRSVLLSFRSDETCTIDYISASLILESSSQGHASKPLHLDALLMRREREIMELILQNLTHADIASRLVISPRTVEKHRANVMQKLALNMHTELILFALQHGLLSSA